MIVIHTRLRAIATVSLLALSGALSSLGAETVNCTPITAVPTTITAPGIYCFTHDITTGISSGYAVQILANNVVLDLNGHRLQGQAAGPGTLATGIAGIDRRNVTVRNGSVRGFATAIALTTFTADSNSQGHIVEELRVDFSTVTGINVRGTGCTVRNNIVRATGGSTVLPEGFGPTGISVTGVLNRVLNNDVLNMVLGSAPSAVAVEVGPSSQGGVVENNRLGNATPPPGGRQVRGIDVGPGSANILMVNNRFTLFSTAIACDPQSTGMIRDNISFGGTGGYAFCTDAGNNKSMQ